MSVRHAVEITVPDKAALHRLREHDVDIVRHSVEPRAGGFSVEGLLTEAEVERLRGDGFEVRVVEPAHKRARAHRETTTFADWLAAVEAGHDAPGYLDAAGLDAAVQHLSTAYPSICHAVELPEPSVEGRAIRAVRIGSEKARGIFFLAGVHAREVVNPDLLAAFGLRLCRAHAAGRGLSFGEKHYPAAEVARLLDGLSLYLLPLANPDGRAWVQDPQGDPMWRKNRRLPDPASPRCHGVDLNRNYDFLWSAGLTSSARPCSETFRGPAAFSEPETRNVRHVLEAHPHLRLFVDLHAYSQTVFYPWGDDEDQSEDRSMTFANPAFDGLRGKLHDHAYREYIPAEDLGFFRTTAGHVCSAIAAAHGTSYRVQQAVGLYPTSGCGDDYAYACGLAGKGPRVMSFTVETGKAFQPHAAEAARICTEVSAGLVAFCQAALRLPG